MRKYSIGLLLLLVGTANVANAAGQAAIAPAFTATWTSTWKPCKHHDCQRACRGPRTRATPRTMCEMPPGEGVWGTVIGLGSYRLKFADTKTGQVAVFGAIDEADGDFGVRAAPQGGGPQDQRSRDAGGEDQGFRCAGRRPNPFANPKFEDKPILLQNLKPGEGRLTRAS